MTQTTILTADGFKIPAVGMYSFEGRGFEVTERLSGYGSGKKTVYSFVEGGMQYNRLDILQVKKHFGVTWSGSKKGNHRVTAPVPAAVTESEPEQQATEIEAPAPKAASDNVIRHERFDLLLKVINNGLCPYLFGPAGSGKNVVCQQIADYMGLPFYYANSVTQEFKMAGFTDAGGRYHETEFYKAFTTGGLFMFDEMDCSAPEVLKLMNCALANKYFVFEGAGRVEAHPDFYCIAAGNTIGTGADDQYTAASVIDASSLDRFMVIKFDYCPKVEESIAKNDPAALEFIRDLRTASKACGLSLVLGYRGIIKLIKMAQIAREGLMSMAEAVWSSCTPGVDADGIRTLRAAWAGNRDNVYFKAL